MGLDTENVHDVQQRILLPRCSDIENLPCDVSTEAQLALIPDTFKSDGTHHKPLKHVDEDTNEVFTYALQPMRYAVGFILLVELMERFSYYGIIFTETSYLTGVYDHDWNAGMTALEASSYVSMGVAMAYTSPFCGALLADVFLGYYWSIVVGCICFYIPGLLLIMSTTIPYGRDFNRLALSFGLLLLWPVGTGIVKSVNNVFGAKQFHPILQSRLIESYYVSFYMVINIGSLAGGFAVPILAQHNITLAYSVPVIMLLSAMIVFLSGTSRYCISRPRGDLIPSNVRYCGKKTRVSPPSKSSQKRSLWSILRICCLAIPFNIVYSQQATMFIVQGTVMRKEFGFLDAPSMNNVDALAVLFFGALIGKIFYPWLAKKNIKIATTHKFAIGSALGALSIMWAMVVQHLIIKQYLDNQKPISVLWQAPSYILVGAGEIFTISTAYEIAFTSSPPDKKALASAINIFCIGGAPNAICLVLYHICSPWFQNADGKANIHTLELYTEAHVGHYFLVLLGIAFLGIGMNILPSIKNYVLDLEESAASVVKTPLLTPSRPKRNKEDETSSLLESQKLKHQYVLDKPGSFRAAPFLHDTKNNPAKKQLDKNRKGYLMRIKSKGKVLS